MTKKQKNKTTEDKDETIIEMAPIIKEKYTKLFLIISLTLSSLSIVLMIFFFIWFSSNDFEEKIYQETIKSSDNLNKVINNFKNEIKQEIENLRNDFVTNNQKQPRTFFFNYRCHFNNGLILIFYCFIFLFLWHFLI